MVETPRLQAKQSFAKSTNVDELDFVARQRRIDHGKVSWFSVGFEPTDYEPLAL
jgi:hypothetical protein